MEFVLYGNIIKRRFWLIPALLGIVLASYVLTARPSVPTYNASMRFVVGIRPETGSNDYHYDRYYTWLTAEYLVDDMSEVVKSRAFAQDVATVAGIDVPVGAIQGATSAGKLHRILTVSVTWGNPEQLAQIANAIVRVMQERGATYFAQLATESAVISLIDPPGISPVGPSLRQRVDLPLRLILALVAAVGLAFLLDYLDPSVRHRADLQALGLPILGEIPSQEKRRVAWRRRSLP